jgi:phosphohistidine phosphatase
MDLYVIRHAEAVSLAQSDVNADSDRPLTEHGHAQTKALAAALLRRGVQLDVVLTSPYLRARQTAQGLLDHWTVPLPELSTCDELAPDGKASKLARVLRKLKAESVALVGHMPDLAAQVAWLIGSKKSRIDLEKAGIARIHCRDLPDKSCGSLVWLITPEWFMGEPVV